MSAYWPIAHGTVRFERFSPERPTRRIAGGQESGERDRSRPAGSVRDCGVVAERLVVRAIIGCGMVSETCRVLTADS